ncbi:hypothetical protein MRX96_026193 [Rhipicephalus microplus]
MVDSRKRSGTKKPFGASPKRAVDHGVKGGGSPPKGSSPKRDSPAARNDRGIAETDQCRVAQAERSCQETGSCGCEAKFPVYQAGWLTREVSGPWQSRQGVTRHGQEVPSGLGQDFTGGVSSGRLAHAHSVLDAAERCQPVSL